MNKLKKLYRDFFGLREAATPTSNIPKILPHDEIEKSIVAVKKYGDAMKAAGLLETDEIDEAQLVNNITDYRGGVEYVLRDPAEAQSVASEIRQWSEKKGFTVVTNKISKSGKVGYFYFRLGQDPALESQKIQGYIAQKPEIKHFRFNVRGEQTPAPETSVAPIKRRNPNINI
jgi:hypothetical protein